MLFKASAPGSMMLMGEYAVLHDKPALVCAIDKRVEVTLTPRTDDLIRIESDRLGLYQVFLKDLAVEKPFKFISAAIKHYHAKINTGFDLKITSQFSHQVGLGSSAAVTVATLAVLIQWLKLRMGPTDLIRIARTVVREVQGGVGSGADVAASVMGGVVLFQAQPLSVEKIAMSLPLIAYYAGFKTPTPEAIARVKTRFESNQALFRHLCQAIAECVVTATAALKNQNFRLLGELMSLHQGLHHALGVNLPVLANITDALCAEPHVFGAKISGSGLGDCVIGLGKLTGDLSLPATLTGVQRLHVNVSMEGVMCEAN
jgi:mevalonate kinase